MHVCANASNKNPSWTARVVHDRKTPWWDATGVSSAPVGRCAALPADVLVTVLEEGARRSWPLPRRHRARAAASSHVRCHRRSVATVEQARRVHDESAAVADSYMVESTRTTYDWSLVAHPRDDEPSLFTLRARGPGALYSTSIAPPAHLVGLIGRRRRLHRRATFSPRPLRPCPLPPWRNMDEAAADNLAAAASLWVCDAGEIKDQLEAGLVCDSCPKLYMANCKRWCKLQSITQAGRRSPASELTPKSATLFTGELLMVADTINSASTVIYTTFFNIHWCQLTSLTGCSSSSYCHDGKFMLSSIITGLYHR